MVQICCVEGCDDEKEDLMYFKLPKSQTRLFKWLAVFTPVEELNSDSVICSQHFMNREIIIVDGLNRLKPGAVPSIFSTRKSKEADITKTQQEIQNNNLNKKTDTVGIITEDLTFCKTAEDLEEVITPYAIRVATNLEKVNCGTDNPEDELKLLFSNCTYKRKKSLGVTGEIGTDAMTIEISCGEIGEIRKIDTITIDDSSNDSVDKADARSQDSPTMGNVKRKVGPHEPDNESNKIEDKISLSTTNDVILKKPKITVVEIFDETEMDKSKYQTPETTTINSTKSTESEKCRQPEKSAQPQKSAQWEESAQPKKSTQPKKSAQPKKSTQSKKSAQPEKSTQLEKSVQLDKCTQPEKSTKSAKPKSMTLRRVGHPQCKNVLIEMVQESDDVVHIDID